jgi:predicted DNA-binding protein YlxM (UPF0122 family)
MLEKLEQFVMLNDFYGALLTEKQRRILKDYYENDFSLSEIADDMNTSRQAVYDLIKRAEHQLLQYETKLGLLGKFRTTHRNLEKVCDLLENDEMNADRLHVARHILRETIELL